MSIKPATIKPSGISGREAKVSYEAFVHNIDEDMRAEWVDGEAIPMSPVSTRHQRIGRFIIALISRFLEERPLGELFYESFQMKTGTDLPGRAPDVVFVATENLHRLKEAYLDGPGNVVVEIVSLESQYRDRNDKLREYEVGGVREYWLIDPIRSRVEFYQLNDSGRYTLASLEDGSFRSRILSGLRIDPEWLLQEPLPTMRSVSKAAGILPDTNEL